MERGFCSKYLLERCDLEHEIPRRDVHMALVQHLGMIDVSVIRVSRWDPNQTIRILIDTFEPYEVHGVADLLCYTLKPWRLTVWVEDGQVEECTKFRMWALGERIQVRLGRIRRKLNLIRKSKGG